MTQQLALHVEELARKAAAIKTISLGFIGASILGVVSTIIIWAFNRDYPVIPITIISVIGVLTSSLTYWLVRAGKVKFAGYFSVIIALVESAIIVTMIGGFTGPMATIYLLPILIAGMVISVNASFLAATLAAVFYLAMIPVEQASLLPQLVGLVAKEGIISVMTAGIMIIFFYLVAFLSWFAASRLNRALQSVRRYADELQTTNEKLQASEEEIRASNEELRAANEELQATGEELRAANEELQAANEELKETQEKLVRSERLAAIGQLAGGVGHELRNPLGAIKNAVYYIRGKVVKSELAQKEPRVIEFLGIVDDEIASSTKIISDLLSFSRVGKPAVSPARIDKVIDDALSHTPIPENIELTKKVMASLPEVEIDADQVRQVLVNMITNAVQAMPEGGKLAIAARAKDSFLEVEIADTGCGIAEKAMDKLFEPLYTTKAKGIGLGLAVCKSIIDRHDGYIVVASSVGKGTTFTIKLPLKAK